MNKEDNGGETALHNAAFAGDLGVFKYLISQGADAEIRKLMTVRLHYTLLPQESVDFEVIEVSHQPRS